MEFIIIGIVVIIIVAIVKANSKTELEKVRDKLSDELYNHGSIEDLMLVLDDVTGECYNNTELRSLASRGYCLYFLTRMGTENLTYTETNIRLTVHFSGYDWNVKTEDIKAMHNVYQEFLNYNSIKPNICFNDFHCDYETELSKAFKNINN